MQIITVTNFKRYIDHLTTDYTSSSAVPERPRELGDFIVVGQFEAKF